jgi:hypothetical protein
MPADKVGGAATDAEHGADPLGTFGAESHHTSRSLEAPAPLSHRKGFLDWMFRSRRNGRITLVQLPNWPLGVWLLASVVMWLGHPQGGVGDSLFVLASAALALWAGDEALRGVNPFRRLVGAAVLAWLFFSLVTRLTA